MFYSVLRITYIGLFTVGLAFSGPAANAQMITIRPITDQRQCEQVDPITQAAQQRAIQGTYHSFNSGGEPGTLGIMIGLAGCGLLYPTVRRLFASRSGAASPLQRS
ncbi:MAG: hypothetical protein JWL77_3068 [Chthonomonadaceae bacterium]|nr:hypothetical protein [Chthonomonadaceae bacterium]